MRTFLATFIAAAWVFCHADAVEFSTVRAGDRAMIVCRVNVTKEPLELFLRDDHGAPLKSFEGINRWLQPQGRKLVFAMNAGMYEPNLSPVGLFVSQGREISPLNLRNAPGNFYLKPNGIFLISNSGAHVIDSLDYEKFRGRVTLATQSGPLLVHHSKIHPRFKPDSDSRLYRNGVGIPSPDTALFVISEAPLNLYEFAAFFRDELHCPDALFLDGTVSSLFAPSLHRADRRIDLGPIIGVTEKRTE